MVLKLNKSTFLIPVFLLFVGICSAQQHFKGGLTLGIATSQVSGDTYAGFNKVGLTGGGFIQLSISDKLAAQFEINYIQKGSRKIADPNNGDFSEYLMKLGYVEIPLLVRFYIEKASLEIGPSFGLLVSSQETGVNGQPLTGSEFNFIDLGLNLGLSYQIKERIELNTRFSNSVIPTRDYPLSAVNNQTQLFAKYFNRGQYNTVVTFALRYML